MIYFIFTNSSKVHVERIIDADGPDAYKEAEAIGWDRVETSNEFEHDWSRVSDLACQATTVAGETYLPVDRGSSTSPRYSVVKAPKVGDKISYAFNGDYTPCGEITKVSKSFRKVTSSNGRVFWRSGQTASWLNGGTWSMVGGHIEKRNPSF